MSAIISTSAATQLIKTVATTGTIIIGTSALTFGLYDIYHLKWTGDLKVMTTTLDISAFLLFGMAYFQILNPIIAITFAPAFLIASYTYLKETKNPALAHEPRKQKQFWQIINDWYNKHLTKKQPIPQTKD